MKNVFVIQLDNIKEEFQVLNTCYSNKLMLHKAIWEIFPTLKPHKNSLEFYIVDHVPKNNWFEGLDSFNKKPFTYPRLLALCARAESTRRQLIFRVQPTERYRRKYLVAKIMQLKIVSKDTKK